MAHNKRGKSLKPKKQREVPVQQKNENIEIPHFDRSGFPHK